MAEKEEEVSNVVEKDELFESPAAMIGKLQFLCRGKLGQISSPDRGLYADGAYPTEAQFAAQWRVIAVEQFGIELPTPVEEEEEDVSPIIDEENIDITEGETTTGEEAS